MTVDEAIELATSCIGTKTEKLAAIAAVIPQIDVAEVIRKGPVCPCGTELTVWYGRHSEKTLVYHPTPMRPCPRAGMRVVGENQSDAMANYLRVAPALPAQKLEPPKPPKAVADDDFSGEFQ